MIQAKVKPVFLHPKQRELLASDAWVRGYVGGRGSGKTYGAVLDILLNSKDKDSWMVVSPSYVVSEETTWPTLTDAARDLGVFVKATKVPVQRVRFKTQDGGQADVIFRSADKPEHLRGGTKSGLWFDEASIMSEEAYDLSIPVLRKGGKRGKLILTFTPRGTKHWTFGVFYQRLDDQMDVPPDAEWFGGAAYVRRPNTHLIQAHTSQNPFLPATYYDDMRSRYTEAFSEQELAGKFVDLAGLVFHRDWFRVIDIPQAGYLDRVRYWDKAATHGSGCYTAGVLMSRTPEGVFTVEDVVRGQWSAEARNQIIRETAEKDAQLWRNTVQIYLEQEPGSGGKESMTMSLRQLAGFPAHRDIVSGASWRKQDAQRLPGDAKVVRAWPMAAQAEAGNVQVLRRKWTGDYLEELCAFPESQYADQVDASSGAFNKLAKYAGAWSTAPEPREHVKATPDRYGVQVQTIEAPREVRRTRKWKMRPE